MVLASGTRVLFFGQFVVCFTTKLIAQWLYAIMTNTLDVCVARACKGLLGDSFTFLIGPVLNE